jgi:hypothetical protein
MIAAGEARRHMPVHEGVTGAWSGLLRIGMHRRSTAQEIAWSRTPSSSNSPASFPAVAP